MNKVLKLLSCSILALGLLGGLSSTFAAETKAAPESVMMYNERQLLVFYSEGEMPDLAGEKGCYRLSKKFGYEEVYAIESATPFDTYVILTMEKPLKKGQFYNLEADNDLVDKPLRMTVLGYSEAYLQQPLMFVMAEQSGIKNIRLTFDKMIQVADENAITYAIQDQYGHTLSTKEVQVGNNIIDLEVDVPLYEGVQYSVQIEGLDLFSRNKQSFSGTGVQALVERIDFFQEEVEKEVVTEESDTKSYYQDQEPQSFYVNNNGQVVLYYEDEVDPSLEDEDDAFVIYHKYDRDKEEEILSVDVDGRKVLVTPRYPLLIGALYTVEPQKHISQVTGGVTVKGNSVKATGTGIGINDVYMWSDTIVAVKFGRIPYHEDAFRKENYNILGDFDDDGDEFEDLYSQNEIVYLVLKKPLYTRITNQTATLQINRHAAERDLDIDFRVEGSTNGDIVRERQKVTAEMKDPQRIELLFEYTVDQRAAEVASYYEVREREGAKRSFSLRVTNVDGNRVELTLRKRLEIDDALLEVIVDEKVTRSEKDLKNAFLSVGDEPDVDVDLGTAEAQNNKEIIVHLESVVDYDELLKPGNYTIRERHGDRIELEIDTLTTKGNYAFINLKDPLEKDKVYLVVVDDRVTGEDDFKHSFTLLD